MRLRDLLDKVLSSRGISFLVTRFGPPSLRAAVFDEKFRNGEWRFVSKSDDPLVAIVEQHAAGGDILMLGCGTASIAPVLRQDAYRSFLGIDISTEAIRQARQWENEKIGFEVGDMCRICSTRRYTVILFSESLYYVPVWRRIDLLERLGTNLEPQGVFIVTFAEPRRFWRTLSRIRSVFDMIADSRFPGRERWVLVFRSRPR